MTENRHIHKIQPYQRLAVYYDQLMEYIDYDIWIDDLDKLVKPFNPGSNWLDISCGTGSMAIRLAKKGREMTAVDLSPFMVEIARSKASQAHAELAFHVGNMINFDVQEQYDVIINLHDGLNYLLDSNAIDRFLENSVRLLKPEGILLFDVATPLLCQRHFRGYRELFNDESGGYERFTTYDPNSRLAESVFTLNTSDDTTIEVETHIQKAYELEEVERFCMSSAFGWWQILDDESLEKGTSESERYLVMMRKDK